MEPAKIALASSGNGVPTSHPVDPVEVRRQQYQTPGIGQAYTPIHPLLSRPTDPVVRRS